MTHQSPVKSAARVLEVLELFGHVRSPLSLKEIVAELGYPQSSATFLMKSLTSMGYVNYDRKARTYFPTFKVASLGSWLDAVVQSGVWELLKQIQADTGETVMLAGQNDLYIQYLEVLDSDHQIRFHVKKGSMVPMTRTSLGWMLLSTKSASEVELLCKQINARSTADMQVDIPVFQKKLETVRREQFCYVPNLPMQAGGSISVLLPSKAGMQQMVVGTGGLVERLDANFDAILRSMRKHIQALLKDLPL